MEISALPSLTNLDWLIFLVAALAVFAGAVVQGSVGLGLGMVAAPVLMFIDTRFVPGPMLFLACVVSILIAYRERHSIDRPGLAYALLGRVPGTVIAGMTIAAIPLALYNLIFGLLVIAAVLLNTAGWKVLPSTRNLFIAGFASGYMGTLTSIGAPPMAIVYTHREAAVIRSTLAAFFFISSAISMAILHYFGKFDVEGILIGIGFIVPLMVGFWVSGFVVRRINTKVVRYSVLTLAGLSGVALVIKYFAF